MANRARRRPTPRSRYPPAHLSANSPAEPEAAHYVGEYGDSNCTARWGGLECHGDPPPMRIFSWLSRRDSIVERIAAQVRWGICYGNKPCYPTFAKAEATPIVSPSCEQVGRLRVNSYEREARLPSSPWGGGGSIRRRCSQAVAAYPRIFFFSLCAPGQPIPTLRRRGHVGRRRWV